MTPDKSAQLQAELARLQRALDDCLAAMLRAEEAHRVSESVPQWDKAIEAAAGLLATGWQDRVGR